MMSELKRVMGLLCTSLRPHIHGNHVEGHLLFEVLVVCV
jgi:hypothetical protein